MHCHTTWGQWALQLLQCSASLLGGSGQCNCCDALPHCLGPVGSATPTVATASSAKITVAPAGGPAHCGSGTAHHPQAVWQCIAGVALPTDPKKRGSALQEFQCLLPPGSEAVHCRSSTAQCPKTVRQYIAGVPLSRQRPPPGQVFPSPQLVGPRIAGAALPTAHRQCGSALQEFHCLLPPGSEAVHGRSCTAHCPKTLRQYIAGVPLFRQRPPRGQVFPSDGESCARGGRCLWSACRGRQPPSARAHQMGGRGVLPGRRSLPMERLRGMAAPIGAGPPAQGIRSLAQ